MKTVRFSRVVAHSGKPEPHTLWTKPEDDRALQAALKAHRVMTVHQEVTGNKKDYGEVGFQKGQGNLLIFPKSLKPFESLRVVGVKYDLLAEAAAEAPSKSLTSKPVPTVAKPKPPAVAKPKPAPAAKATPAAAPRPAPAAPKFGPLRLVRAEEAATPPPKVKKGASAPRPDPSASFARLAKEVRRAMKELQSGKAVAAYQTLEQALAGSREST